MKYQVNLQWLVITIVFSCLTQTAFCQDDFWQPSALTNKNVLSLAINSNDHIFAGINLGPGGTIFRSIDNGENWIEVNNGLSTNWFITSLATNSSGVIFAGSDTDGIFRSTDNGENWTQINNGLTNTHVPALIINSNDHIFSGTEGGVFRSIDNGDSWVQIGLTNVWTLSFAINSSGHIWAGTNGGLNRSTNNGESWSEINVGLDNPVVWSIAINTNDHIFVGTSNSGVFRSENNGDSWIVINAGLTSTDVRTLAINTFGHIFAGTGAAYQSNGGAFLSTDNGNSWSEVSTGLTNTDIRAIAFNSSGYTFVGTREGVFRSVEATVSVKEIYPGMPSSFELNQNFPNPFNPATTIRYRLPKSTQVILKIYNLLGQEVRTLVNETQTTGYKSVIWDGKNNFGQSVSSGIYIYRLQTPEFVKAKKLLLLR